MEYRYKFLRTKDSLGGFGCCLPYCCLLFLRPKWCVFHQIPEAHLPVWDGSSVFSPLPTRPNVSQKRAILPVRIPIPSCGCSVNEGVCLSSSFFCMAVFNLIGPMLGCPFVTGTTLNSFTPCMQIMKFPLYMGTNYCIFECCIWLVRITASLPAAGHCPH